LVWAGAAVALLAAVAVEAKDLEPGGEVVAKQPLVDTCGREGLTVLGPVVVDVVDSEKHDLGLAAAGAPAAVVVEDRLAERDDDLAEIGARLPGPLLAAGCALGQPLAGWE
jgi:hypothetical protein